LIVLFLKILGKDFGARQERPPLSGGGPSGGGSSHTSELCRGTHKKIITKQTNNPYRTDFLFICFSLF